MAISASEVRLFANITGSAEDDWLGTGIAETVTADLKGVAGLAVLSRERVQEVLRHLPEPGAGGNSESPISTRTSPSGTPRVSAAIWASTV